jgi:hypothetical protein
VRTEELIDALSADTPAAPRDAIGRRIAIAVVVGAAASFAVMLAWLGLRPDLAQAVGDVFFWIKLAYAICFALAGAMLVDRYGRPGGLAGRRWLLVFAPIAVLALIALATSLGRPAAALRHDWMGWSWRACPFRILALAAPVFVAALWGFRRLAPTRLRLAGFAAGLLAGGTAASVYCLFCRENTALFVVTWYTLGIFACGGIGALTGPRLLRW